MAAELQRIQQGSNVYSSDGDKVGDVSEVGRNYVLVQKGWLLRMSSSLCKRLSLSSTTETVPRT